MTREDARQVAAWQRIESAEAMLAERKAAAEGIDDLAVVIAHRMAQATDQENAHSALRCACDDAEAAGVKTEELADVRAELAKPLAEVRLSDASSAALAEALREA